MRIKKSVEASWKQKSLYKNLFLFCFLVILSFAFQGITQKLILTKTIVSEYLQNQMSYDSVLKALEIGEKWAWVNYILIPVIYLIKFALISLWFLCGAILFGFKTNFTSIFKAVLEAEFVWLVPPLLLIVWFGLIDTSYTFNEVQYFAPLSLLSLFDASQLDNWLIYPLKSLNLFEVSYLLALALGIKNIMKKDYDSALKFTLPVYGSALVVWILFVTFLSINLGA